MFASKINIVLFSSIYKSKEKNAVPEGEIRSMKYNVKFINPKVYLFNIRYIIYFIGMILIVLLIYTSNEAVKYL